MSKNKKNYKKTGLEKNTQMTLQSNKETTDIIISTIIPVFNAADFLVECLESVLNQEDMKNIEVICVDDCSTDNSLEILNSYADKDHRVKVIANESNKSAGACRNTGIEIAQGRYIHFLDADDWIEQDAYKKWYECISSNDADICVCLYNKYDNVTGEVTKPMLFPYATGEKHKFEEKRSYYLNTSVVPWNKLYRSEFLKANGITFDSIVCANDRTFYFDSITQASEIVFIKEFLINYRINNSSSLVGQARNKHYDCHFTAYESSKKRIFTRISEDAKKLFIKTGISDIIGFYHKVGYNFKMSQDVGAFFNSISEDIEFIKDTYVNEPFHSEVEILKTFSQAEGCIPIVFATNNNYAPYMSVAIQSLIACSDPGNKYYIYVLYSDLEDRYINIISGLSTENVKINFINVNSKIEKEIQTLYSRAHYSKEMYYRILIADLFRPFEKVLYLDCDIVVRSDVAELYNIDIGDNIIGGITNVSSEQMTRYITNQLKLPVNEYVNSGILLFNCIEFRNNYIKEKCFHLISQNSKYVCPDQDIINLTCNGKIAYLDMKWNFQWYYSILDPAREDKITLTKDILNRYTIAEKEQKILHFTSGIKAWNSPDRKDAYLFWEYARNNPLYNEIVCKNIAKIISFSVNNKQIVSLKKQIDEYKEKLDWNRNECKRLTEENQSLLAIISSKLLNEKVKDNTPADIKKLMRERDDYLYQIQEIRKSFSYKLGMFITWLPRKIIKLIKRK